MKLIKKSPEEGRIFLHPFEGFETALGTSTLGYEFHQQANDLEAIIVPVGGGGLISGVGLPQSLLTLSMDCLALNHTDQTSCFRVERKVIL